MKALVIIAVVAGGLFLLVKSSSFSFYAYSVTTSANGTAELHCYTGCNTDVVKQAEYGSNEAPIVQDAIALAGADQSPGYIRAMMGMSRVVRRARRLSPLPGATLVWTDVPRYLAVMDSDESGILGRIRALNLNTSKSEPCRETASRLVARQQASVRELEIRIAQSRPGWSAFTRFVTDWNASRSGYIDEIGPCLDAAPQEDRARLAYVMARF
jgi:hypothetical protein